MITLNGKPINDIMVEEKASPFMEAIERTYPYKPVIYIFRKRTLRRSAVRHISVEELTKERSKI